LVNICIADDAGHIGEKIVPMWINASDIETVLMEK